MTEPGHESLRGRVGAVLRTSRFAIAIELVLILGLIALKIARVIQNPQLLLVLLGWVSLWVRGEGWRGVGLRLPSNWPRVVVLGTLIGLAYNALDIFVVLPIIHRISGTPLQLETLEGIQGNVPMLAVYLVATWTLFAFGEEMGYRGYMLNRAADLFGRTNRGWIMAGVLVVFVFATQHVEQGVAGVIDNFLGGAVLVALYLLSGKNLWLPIIAHGVEDTSSLILLFAGFQPPG